jgi:NADH-quinone oxidoreductase subunit J
MTMYFLILAVIAIAGLGAAMSLRNPVHCVVGLTVGFVGVAALYLQLGAQFAGFTQVLVYIGAVAILIVFAIMMTRNADTVRLQSFSPSWVTGVAIAACAFVVFAWAIHFGMPQGNIVPAQPDASINAIGNALLRRYVLPLEIIGLLLTAALIGAGVLAMEEARRER